MEKLCNLVTGQPSLRLDGQTTNKQRAEVVQRINDPTSHDRKSFEKLVIETLKNWVVFINLSFGMTTIWTQFP